MAQRQQRRTMRWGGHMGGVFGNLARREVTQRTPQLRLLKRPAQRTGVSNIIQFARNRQGQTREQQEHRQFVNPYDRGEQEGRHRFNREMHTVQQQENAKRELEEIRKTMDRDHLMELNRERLPKEQKELYDLRALFFNAIAEGEVRNFKDFYHYLQKWLAETHQNPKQAAYADTAMKKFLHSFMPEQRQRLERSFGNLAIIARGGDPYD